MNKIALLATGEELTNGDVLNTNSQAIAYTLSELGFAIGMHLTVSDEQIEIESALQFLLREHFSIIITGGLGPTSDDRTRFALANVIQKPLLFDELSWQRIVERFTHFKLIVHESNKQQALFPETALIFPNINGTASGCMINHNSKLIFLLPGPPRECIPMFNDYVIPQLTQFKTPQDYHFYKWRLFGVSEGEIAALLDKLVKPYHGLTGYRWDYPYLEFKLKLPLDIDKDLVLAELHQTLQPYQISTACLTAVEILQQTLLRFPYPVYIDDQATAGLLQHKLFIPELYGKIYFKENALPSQTAIIKIYVTGLDEWWQNKPPAGHTHLHLEFTVPNQEKMQITKQIPYRNKGVIVYAVEYICFLIKNFLNDFEK